MGCAASLDNVIEPTPEEVEKERQRRDADQVFSEASKLGFAPEEPLRSLTKEETSSLLDQVLGDVDFFNDWRFGEETKLYYEDPAPKLLAALTKLHAKFTDYEWDVGCNAGPWMVNGKEHDNPGLISEDCNTIANKWVRDCPERAVKNHIGGGLVTDFQRLSERLHPDDVLFGAHGIDCRDVKQPSFGDCWYVSLMSALLYSAPELVASMFSPAKLNHYGLYSVRLFINNVPCYMLIDDYHPSPESGMFLLPGNHGRHHYFKLLEKVWMKLDTCYGGFDGHMSEYTTLSGKNKFGQYEEFFTGGLLRNMPHQSWPTSVQEFKEIFHNNFGITEFGGASNKRYWATCDSKKYAGNGIVRDHAYSLLWFGRIAEQDLLVLRNPHGRTEWTGAWSDESGDWTTSKGREVKKALLATGYFSISKNRLRAPTLLPEHFQLSTSDDGVFFIGLADFLRNFESLQLIDFQHWSPLYSTKAKEIAEEYTRRRKLVSEKCKKAGPVVFVDPASVDTKRIEPITVQTNPAMRIKWSRHWNRKEIFGKMVPTTVEYQLGVPNLRPKLDYEGVNHQPGDTAYCMLSPSGESLGKEWHTPGYNPRQMTHSIFVAKWDAFTGQGGDSGGGWDLGSPHVLTGFTMYCPPCDDDSDSYPATHNPHPARLRVSASTGDALSTAYRHLQTLVASVHVEKRGKEIKDRANCVYRYQFDKPVKTRFICIEMEDVHDFKVYRDRPLGCIDGILWEGYAVSSESQEEESDDVITSIIKKARPKAGKGGPAPCFPGQTFTLRSADADFSSFTGKSEGDGVRWSKRGATFQFSFSPQQDKETSFLLRESLLDEGRGVQFDAIHSDLNVPANFILRHYAPKQTSCELDNGEDLDKNIRFLEDTTFIPEFCRHVSGAVQFRSLAHEEFLLGLTDDGTSLCVREEGTKGTAWINTATSASPPVGPTESLKAGTVVYLVSAAFPEKKVTVTDKLEGDDRLADLDPKGTAFIVHDSKIINACKRFEMLDTKTNKGTGMYMWTKNGTCFVIKPDEESWGFHTQSGFFAEKCENTNYPHAVQFRLQDRPENLLGYKSPYVALVGGVHESQAFTVEALPIPPDS